ncbi:MAG TPA: sigma-70 family RNA polymerase sigma factor [Vicinamibacterales bacterium]|jgi:RNA polymerase sigma-70 factor (ECF subfamily)
MNDREATLRRWLAEHRGILVRITRAYATSPGDEDDLMQEILIALWQSLPSFRGASKVSTWIYQVALHVSLSRRRAHRRRPESIPLDRVAEPSRDGEAEAHGRMRWTAVLAALRRLAPVDRALLVLALEGASQQDIADVLGISANAAGVKLHRARRRLAEILEA